MKLPVICPDGECCHGSRGCVPGKGLPKIVLVGSPNVGKSSLFNALSGSYTLVSNYPGTSVEISRGKSKIGEREYEIIVPCIRTANIIGFVQVRWSWKRAKSCCPAIEAKNGHNCFARNS